MFQTPGSPEMARIVHEIEHDEVSRRIRLAREAGTRADLRWRVGRVLIAVGVAIGGERLRSGDRPQPGGAVGPALAVPGGAATEECGCRA